MGMELTSQETPLHKMKMQVLQEFQQVMEMPVEVVPIKKKVLHLVYKIYYPKETEIKVTSDIL